MSQSPLGSEPDPDSPYFDSFVELAERIRQGASFSGRERNCAFLNLGGKSFADASAALELDLPQDSRGIAICDWDHDGDLDFWMTNRTAPRLQLMQNENAGRGAGSVGFLLEGDAARRCPRDAAGARVVLSAGGGERVQTVHLGDGFVSQSSRWLHFGLGGIDSIDQVVVHWPAGAAESFAGAHAGGRFLLRQGTGLAVAAAEMRLGSLETGGAELPAPTDIARIWLSEPASLPADLVIPNLPAGPALLNLWAAWCAPCVKELEAFGAIDGLPLVPLNVENLEGGNSISAKQAQARLLEAGIEQPGGFATPEIITALNELVADRIYRHRKLPLPASFLLDRQHRVRAIYKGEVDVEVVLADLERLDNAGLDPLDAAVPIPGRWALKNFNTNPIAVAAAFMEGGYHGDAREYLENLLPSLGGEEAAAKLRRGDVYAKLGAIESADGNLDAAISRYARALEENPQLVPAHIYLTLALARAGRVDEALGRVSKLKAMAPTNPDFANLEADVYRIAGDERNAATAYQAVLEMNARYIPAVHALASIRALSTDGEVLDGAEAVRLAKLLLSSPGAISNPAFLNTMADAHAAVGNFPMAAETATKALALLLPYADDETLDQQRQHIANFQREESSDAPAD